MKAVRTVFTPLLMALIALAAIAQDKHPPNSTNGGAASGASPLLVIGSFTHDFGEVKPGTPLRYAFKIKNEGKADLLINSVTPG
jgi:hypothetical protein